eukprot:10353642-Alexandrium_andersonii.AAC.1
MSALRARRCWRRSHVANAASYAAPASANCSFGGAQSLAARLEGVSGRARGLDQADATLRADVLGIRSLTGSLPAAP